MFTGYHVDILAINHNHITWSVDDQDPSQLTIKIFNGENPNELEEIDSVSADTGMYDHYHNMGYHRERKLYYKLELYDGDNKLDSTKVMIAYNNEIDNDSFRYVSRIREYWSIITKPLLIGWVFKKRTWGPKCSHHSGVFEAYEKPGKDCSLCYNTGILGGYFSPIKVHVAISPQLDTIGTKYEMSPNTVTIKLGYYPSLSNEDLVVLYKEGRKTIYEVIQVTKTMFAGFVTSQTANIIEMKSNDIRQQLMEKCS